MIKYISKNLTISFPVAASYAPGDYARLFWNAGESDIDWATPVDNERHELFDGDSGYFGWGHQTWGHHRWGHAQSRNVPGWGHLPWGHHLWGYGSAILEIIKTITSPGYYAFGIETYDAYGNAHSAGTPGSDAITVSLTPKTPSPLMRDSYDAVSDVLTLRANVLFVGARR